MPDHYPNHADDQCVARCRDGSQCERRGRNWTLTTNGVVRRTCDLHDDPHQSMIPIDRIRYG